MTTIGKNYGQISAVIPARNCEDRIAELIETVLDQGPVVREVIVVDRNSSDETVSVALSVGDPRVRILYLTNCKVEEAIRAAANEATGDWILVSKSSRRQRTAALAEGLERDQLVPRKQLAAR